MRLSGDELAQELYRRSEVRGWKITREHADVQAHIIERYQLELTMESFQDSRGLVLFDQGGRVVTLHDVAVIDGYVRAEHGKYGDVMILAEGSLVLGWVHADDVLDLGEPWFSLNVKALTPMPKVFEFLQPCPHLAVHGGWWIEDQRAWECFNCGQAIVDYSTRTSK